MPLFTLVNSCGWLTRSQGRGELDISTEDDPMCVVSFIILQAAPRNQSLWQRSLLLAFLHRIAFAPTWPLLAAFAFAQAIPRRFWQRPLLNSILAPGYLLAAFAFRCYPEYGHFSQPSHTIVRSPLTHIARSPLLHSRSQSPHTQSLAVPSHTVARSPLTHSCLVGRLCGIGL